jgi:membrane-associated phospholipid phosphatase
MDKKPRWMAPVQVGIFLAVICMCNAGWCEEYLSAEEMAAIGAGSAGLLYIGETALEIDSSRFCTDPPNRFDRAMLHFLAGEYHEGRTNFLDSDFGSVLTPAINGITLTLANLTWPQHSSGKDAAQDLYLYLSGLAVTKGITNLSKGIFARHRPLTCLYPEIAAGRETSDQNYDYHSFFSGHASSSFFSATFLNHRLRTIMRQRLSGSDYRDWRWAPPAALFGWATFVAWSRMQCYKHYFTDVVAGAAAGYLIGELFYYFAREDNVRRGRGGTSDQPTLFRITIRF